jgi:IclR family acetate operon transcriptional repressor
MPDYIIPNLLNACRVLKLLAQTPALTVSEIGRELQVPRTTVLRIVTTLCRAGMLQEADGRYRPGSALIPLGMKALEGIDLRRAAQPVLRRLAQATGETAHLAIEAENKSLLIEVSQSPHPIRVGAPAGTFADLHCSATGKIFLTHHHLQELSELFSQLKPQRRTRNTIVTAAAMAKEAQRILQQGYAVDEEEFYEGIRCLAAPVRDSSGKVVAAIGITGTATRFTKDRIPEGAANAMTAAHELSIAIGGQG